MYVAYLKFDLFIQLYREPTLDNRPSASAGSRKRVVPTSGAVQKKISRITEHQAVKELVRFETTFLVFKFYT